jgi:exportin-2 (importin alpha re-exporter)
MNEIVSNNHLEGLLGVFQKLLASKTTEVYAFKLLRGIFCYCPIENLQQYISTILNLMLIRLQELMSVTKTPPFAKHFIHCCCVFVIQHGGMKLLSEFEALSPGNDSFACFSCEELSILTYERNIDKQCV